MENVLYKLSNLNYQRNGIGGEGFFSIFAELKEYSIKDSVIITFEEDESKRIVIISTCRVVSITNPKSSWRGDNIGYELKHRDYKSSEYSNNFYII